MAYTGFLPRSAFRSFLRRKPPKRPPLRVWPNLQTARHTLATDRGVPRSAISWGQNDEPRGPAALAKCALTRERRRAGSRRAEMGADASYPYLEIIQAIAQRCTRIEISCVEEDGPPPFGGRVRPDPQTAERGLCLTREGSRVVGGSSKF